MDLSKPGAFGKQFKCACCNNPWNQSDLSPATSTACRNNSKGFSGIDPDNFDTTVDLADNFYRWSNGGWMNRNTIPPEYSSWNTFMVLRDLNLDRLKAILDEASVAADPSDSEFAKVSSFYQTYMNETLIAEQGIRWLLPILARCHANNDATTLIADLHAKYNVRALFYISSTPDKKASTHSLGYFSQGGLGMPDRDYYFDADKASKREKYLVYITELLTLLGKHGVAEYANDVDCANAAKAVLAFETTLAGSHMTRTAARDPEKTYNKMSINKLNELTNEVSWASYLTRGVTTAALDWKTYCRLIGKPVDTLGDVNVAHVAAVIKAAQLASSPALSHYLCYYVANTFAPHLSPEFNDLHFAYHEKELKGTQEQRPRWKRSLDFVEYALGDALGQKYVQKHFAGTNLIDFGVKV